MESVAAKVTMVVLGLVLCFWGGRTFRAALSLGGFLVGAGLVAGRWEAIPPEPPWLAPVLILLAGILTSLLAHFVYKVALFLLGAGAVIAGLLAFPDLLPIDPLERVLVLVVGGGAGGLLAKLLEKTTVALLTAAVGASLVVTNLFGSGSVESWIWGLWGGLMAFGALVQLSPPRRRRSQEAE